MTKSEDIRPPEEPESIVPHERSLRLGIGLAILAGSVVWLASARSRETPAVDDEPAVLARTLANLEEICGADARPENLAFCEREAEHARRLSSCDAACQALTERWVARPTR